MKKASRKPRDEMAPDYSQLDLGPMVRGKYAQRYREATNVVVIEPDVSKAFPNARAVNEALRGLLRDRKAARTAAAPTRPRRASR